MNRSKLLLLIGLAKISLAAQGPSSDAGTLVVRQAGAVVGHEDFQVRRDGSGWTLSTTSYWGASSTVILAVLTPRRVTIRVSGSGGERARELPVGGTLIVDDSAFAFLALAVDYPAGATRIANPRTGARMDGTIVDRGVTPDGGRHVEVEVGGVVVQVWYDRDGRLLRAHIPSRDLEVTRQ
jgi:hypothetical protein